MPGTPTEKTRFLGRGLWISSALQRWFAAVSQPTEGLRSFLGEPFVKRFALSYRTVVCLSMPAVSCLSVALVYWSRTAGWIKMKLGMEVYIGLGSGHIVLWGHSSPRRGTAPNFRPMSVVAKRLDELRCHFVWRWASA